MSETAIKLQVSVFVVNISAFGENRFNLCYIFGLGLYSISLSFTVPLLVIECKMPILFFEQGCTGQHEQSCVGQHEQGWPRQLEQRLAGQNEQGCAGQHEQGWAGQNKVELVSMNNV